jgi:hypothetical protein
MRGTFGTHLRRSLALTALLSSILVGTVTGAGAASTTSALSACGIVASPAVHLVSKSSPCVIKVGVGTNVRIKFRSGFRWGYPASTSKAVVVTTISRSSIGVNSATLHAAVVGHATVRATGTVACKPGVACPDLALLWIIKVIVT